MCVTKCYYVTRLDTPNTVYPHGGHQEGQMIGYLPPPASVGPGRGGVLVVAVGLREIRALSPALGRADPIRVDSVHTGS